MLLVRCPERELGRGHGRHALAADGRLGRFAVGTGGEGGREGNRGRPSERGEGCETAEMREASGLKPH